MADADTRRVLSFHITYHCNYVIHTKLVTDMARPGVSKAEVQRARLGIMKAGKHPSIDAIRIELGNTGSKATIYRHLKEIEADEGGVSSPSASLSEELQAFVVNLASRLEYESRERIEAQQAGHAAHVKRAAEALERSQAEARGARLDAERLASELASERARRHEVEADLAAAKLALARQTAQLSAQLDGVREQLKSAQSHVASLEEKHGHAREALEHFREASRDQRDREARQHEQQIQYLQGELRNVSDALAAKHGELRSALQEKADALGQLTGVPAEKRQLDELLRELRPAAQRLAAQNQVVDDLRAQASQAGSQYEALLARATALGERNLELERELAALGASAQAQDQLMKDVLARIGAAGNPPILTQAES
ncbi:DNA-binding protein [Mitsuaria sp. GD03876]|uniref:DNA-binding protein n=1 Tax=Mitsuaria sp. GD03876 TaxID=2975399 RepID=UPI002448472B|nr:DNA-binding protein [Mitsuaria sp. GD03876]MDH0863648.1 DNA-binding protein [Mitsuaria sp. GD03876]